ncbi:MAG: hypothetical protein A07HN63_00360 [uncultured archaeon A07HN63]|nr:MAG: hypothetical protein A07HN63_00360 [uncultured archaeon A07HN63]
MTTLDAFQDAVDDTQAYAGALGIGGWLKLAALILLVSLAPSIASRVSRFAAFAGVSGDPLGSASTAVLLAVGAVGFLLIQYINAVADLVIVESLCTNRLAVREYARHNLRRGAELFGFRLALLVVAALIITIPMIATGTLTPADLGTAGPTTGLLIAAGILVAAAVYLVVGTLTTSFVVPIMQRAETGPLAGWGRFWVDSTGGRLAVAGYLVLSWVIAGIATAFKLVVSFFITTFLGAFAVLALSGVEGTAALEVAVGGIFLLGYLLFVYVAAVVLDTPIKSYLWYAALGLLGRFDADLDFVDVAGDGDAATSSANGR